VPLWNDTTRAAAGLLEVAFEGVTIRKRVNVAPGETKLKLTPAESPQLRVKRPRLWWPNGYGRPELYHLRVSFREAGGVESASKSLRFGIRELSYELTLLDGRGGLRRVEYDPLAAQGVRVVNVTHEGMIESAEGWVASFMQVRAMLPASDHWPPDDAWAYHDWHSKSGGDINHFMNAMSEELGAPTSLEDFDRKAQLLTYVSHRAMFEGFNAHLWEPNSGRLMWMTHPAWPSMEWQMYNSDYSTHGAFFGVKKACEPAHAQLDEPDRDITVVNNTTRALKNLLLIVRVVDITGVGISTHEERVNAPANAAVHVSRLDMPRKAGTASSSSGSRSRTTQAACSRRTSTGARRRSRTIES
jgi:hypothetical protein